MVLKLFTPGTSFLGASKNICDDFSDILYTNTKNRSLLYTENKY